jgi:hypothetical protein
VNVIGTLPYHAWRRRAHGKRTSDVVETR